MKKSVFFAAAFAAVCAVSGAYAAVPADAKPVPVMLTVELKSSTSHTRNSGGSGIHRLRRYGSRSTTKSVTRTNTYSARLTCTPPKGVTKRIELEVYKITGSYGGGSTHYKIAGKQKFGPYVYGPGLPTSNTIEFSGATAKSTRRIRNRRRGRGGFRMTSSKSGTASSGVIVRAIMDGRVVQSRVFPSNYKWEKAAKRDGDIGNGDIN